METTTLARIYSLVAQMEAIKATLIAYQQSGNYSEETFHELSDQLNGIANELEQLGHY